MPLVNNEVDSLLKVEVINKNFLSFLEEVIESEKRCDYYSQELMFIIHFQTVGSKKTIQVESARDVMKLGNELAGFNFNDHVFLILGEKIDSSIFDMTNQKIGIDFYEPLEENPASNEVVLDVIEDDSFSDWILENNARFSVIDSFTYCK